MKRKFSKVIIALGVLALTVLLIPGFGPGPSSPQETKIARLRSQLSAAEASIPALDAELKRDIESRWDQQGRDKAQTERWKAIVAKSKGRLGEANRLVIELRLRIREMEAEIEPPPK
jgi:hypothetical protein